MTLDTSIYVLDRIGHRDVFAKCNALIGATEATRSTDEQDCGWKDGECVAVPGNPWTISNEPDQGLPGWLMIHYRPDAPLHTAEDAARHDDCDPDCNGDHYTRACWLEVSLDTAYGYRGKEGGCGDLHAWFVFELGKWLDERGTRWQWRNEFTGEVFDGNAGLESLCTLGAEASAWMREKVLPAILARVASHEGSGDE